MARLDITGMMEVCMIWRSEIFVQKTIEELDIALGYLLHLGECDCLATGLTV